MTSSNLGPLTPSCPPVPGLRTLHVFTLSAFAFTQPLLTSLGQQAVFLHDQHFGWLEIGSVLSLLMFVLPSGLVLVDQLVLRLALSCRRWGHNSVIVFLFGIVLLSLLRPCVSIEVLLVKAQAGLLALALTIPAALLLGWLYDRFQWLRSWLTFASVGLLIFPAMFLWQLDQVHRREVSIEVHTPAGNPVPVVMIVFDEFSGTTLMDGQSGIDERHFPNFARLARLSTWYRNATTVSARTDIAVPAILSGRFPVTHRPPLATAYPGNLFQVVEASKSYAMTVFEPVTRLCPISVRQTPAITRTSFEKVSTLIRTMFAVYPRLILTSDTPFIFPAIPRAWFGLSPVDAMVAQDLEETVEGLFNFPGTENRDFQLRHFLKCLTPGDRPRFLFLHTVLPHFPWCFFPTGEQYLSEQAAPDFPAAAGGELGEDWEHDPAAVLRNEYRYRLQLGYVDRFIGQLLDRLDSTGMLDECLLIVTGDHGVSFRPGHSRRLPDADNLADILSVPLFIKLPHQSESATDDRNVESIDLFPTIAEVLQLQLPEPVDGIPVSRDVRRPRKTLYFETSGRRQMTIVEPDFPQRLSAAQRQRALFANGELSDPVVGASSHPDWHGRLLSEFTVTDPPLASVRFDSVKDFIYGDMGQIVPGFVSGSIDLEVLPAKSLDLALVVDGMICDTARAHGAEGHARGFEFLRSSAAKTPPATVELYLIDQSQPQTKLRRLVDVSHLK